MLKKVFLISLLISGLMLFSACKNIFGPNDPPEPPEPCVIESVEVGEVIYIREDPVQYPEGKRYSVKLILKNEGSSYINQNMEKIEDGKWKLYVSETIIANYPEFQCSEKLKEHIVYVVDAELWDGTEDPNQDYSTWTGKGIYINDQRVLQVEKYKNGTIGKFRIDEQGNLH